jgi:Ca2+-transporting ATPase
MVFSRNAQEISWMVNNEKWYQLPVEAVFELLNAKSSGLTSVEAKTRLDKYGYNELEFKRRSSLVRFLEQFRSPLVYILLVAAAVTSFLAMSMDKADLWMDTVVILGVVILNVLIGYFQEGRAETALDALRKMIVPQCMVLRDGMEENIPTRELVPGDVVLLSGGDRIPADLRLFFTKETYADEASLTGESEPVIKTVDSIPTLDLSPGDQHCIAFSGTFITRGSAKGIVVATGEQTEFGKIAKLMKETQKALTPLQKKIADFTRILIIAILVLGSVNFLLGWLFGHDLLYMFLASVSLIVAAIPEMLPMIVTGILALAATAMAARNALIKRLPAAETLGCTTVICSDKTGTLTKNEMTVVRIHAGGQDYQVSGVGYEPEGDFIFNGQNINPEDEHPGLIETLRAGFQCNNANLVYENDRYGIVGGPTEGALIVSAAKASIREKLHRIDEIPFSSENMYMATLHRAETALLYLEKGENIIYVKGSPERILNMCQTQLVEERIEPVNPEHILAKASEMARGALRVLAMAYKIVPEEKTSLEPTDLHGMTFLGLQGMIDPPRQEAIEAIKKCKTAGIRTVMITGDHVLTAKAIAQQLGITGKNDGGALVGEELSRISDEELYEAVAKVSVYARVSPEHKLRIALQLQKRGEIVAMTGDGVNDAPALKAANIGVRKVDTPGKIWRRLSCTPCLPMGGRRCW